MVTIDTGDTVFHRPSRETWLVACVIGDRLMWCGWPEGQGALADCLLVEKATHAERLDLLHRMAETTGQDARGQFARDKLTAAGFWP